MPRKDAPVAVEAVPEMVPIEELFERHGTESWKRVGLMRYMRWAAGKRTTEAEFLAAMAAWLSGPACGR